MGESSGRRGLEKLVSTHRQVQMFRSQAKVGQKLVELILGSQDWIHRRVEQLEILPSGDCLRRQSVDFTLPSELAIPGTKGRVLLPISLMKKGPLSKFSAIGPDDRAIAVLETGQNGRLAVEMLLAMASNAYGYPLGHDQSPARSLFERIVFSSPADPSSALAELDTLLSHSSSVTPSDVENRAGFRAIATQFCSFFLLVFEVSESVLDQRSLIKFSYMESREDGHGKPRFPVRWEFNDFGLASSFHIEFEPPPLLTVAKLTMTEQIGDGGPTVKEDAFSSPGRIVHIASVPGPLSTAEIVFELAPRRGGVAAVSWTAVRLVSGFFVLVLLGRFLRTVFLGPVPLASPAAAAVLVASGGVLLTWLSRVPEEWIVAKVLESPRNHLFAAALVLLGAAFLLVLPVPEPWRSFAWFGLFVLSIVITAFSWKYRRESHIKASSASPRSRKRPLPAETRQDANSVDYG